MTMLIRDGLLQAIRQLNSAHAGLLMQRGLREWEDGEKPIKKQLILDISSVRPDDLYLLAFNRWLNATYDKTAFATLSATIDGRLFTGLPLGGTLETGAMTHHSYGMPMIAGSSVKGAVRSYTEHLFAKRLIDGSIDYKIENQSGKKIKKLQFDNDKKEILDILFGTDSDDENANAGYLIWHDAWWIPQITGDGKLATGEHKNQPFTSEIVTVHHQQYYNGDLSEALDIENPVPNQQIAIQGSFYFVIEGESKWAEYALKLLQKTLIQQGLGAKGSNGYGYFQLSEELNRDIKNRYERNKPVDLSDPLALIKKKLNEIKADDLADKLTRDRNKFFKELGLDKNNPDDCKNLVAVVMEFFSDKVHDWQNSPNGSNALRAYNFVQNHLE